MAKSFSASATIRLSSSTACDAFFSTGAKPKTDMPQSAKSAIENPGAKESAASYLVSILDSSS